MSNVDHEVWILQLRSATEAAKLNVNLLVLLGYVLQDLLHAKARFPFISEM